MQPCLVMPIILKWWFNYLSISLKGSLQWLDWSKYLTSPWPWRRNTHKQIFVQIAYIFSFPLPVCWKTKWEVFMKDKLLHLWIWKGFERKQLMLSTYFAWGLFFLFFFCFCFIGCFFANGLKINFLPLDNLALIAMDWNLPILLFSCLVTFLTALCLMSYVLWCSWYSDAMLAM